MLVCCKCGRRVTVRYKGNGGIYPTYECNARRQDGLSTKSCLSVRCDLIDSAISRRVLQVLQPAQIDIATEAVRQLDQRDEALSKQWQMRIDRAEYEAQLAERRYEEVDPSNRLVASTLEKRWNDALVKLDALRKERIVAQEKHGLTVTPEQHAKVLALAHDLPRIWNAPSTRAKDKKRMLRLLIKDITLEKAQNKRVVLHVRWQGGACEDIQVSLPPSAADQVRYPEEVVQRVRELARELDDRQVAETLNREGRRPTRSAAFTIAGIRWIRHRHKISTPTFKVSGELSVKEVADRFGVSQGVVYYWIERGIVSAHRRNKGSPYWITLEGGKENELQTWVENSKRIPKAREES